MVGRVLTGNCITRYGDGLDALLQLCRQRLDGFREQRGEAKKRVEAIHAPLRASSFTTQKSRCKPYPRKKVRRYSSKV